MIISALLLLLAALMSMPIIIIFLVLLGAAYASIALEFEVRQLAKRPCLWCGRLIGKKAIQVGRQEQVEYMQEKMKQHHGRRLRVLAQWLIKCENCGCHMIYTPYVKSLRLRSEQN